jgi:hypothetical protein
MPPGTMLRFIKWMLKRNLHLEAVLLQLTDEVSFALPQR